MSDASNDERFMQRALELAQRGEGRVEPNPMVGCVIVRDGQIVGEGWHRAFGGPHAEVEALIAAGTAAAGATLYVTLEPCCHSGKTPPCTAAIVRARIRRVVAAQRDPFPRVAGGGFALLEQAGVRVEVGLLGESARELNAPYLTRILLGRPWVIAKWAMTLDGKIGPAPPPQASPTPVAAASLISRTVSNEASRGMTHRIRARVDAILVGRGTVETDDPLLTVRLVEPHATFHRIPTRIVLDSLARMSPESRLVRSANESPVWVVVSAEAPAIRRDSLRAAGCHVWQADGATRAEQLTCLLQELGRRQMTNVLVEGGEEVLGAFFDAALVDEVHIFISPTISGGSGAPVPVGGCGHTSMTDALRLAYYAWESLDGDLYLHGRTRRFDVVIAPEIVENR